eukprot:superscaffoldBa00002027_g12918
MGFQLDSMSRTVIVPRGTTHTYKQDEGTRDHITILVCFNAAGEDVPPFIIYKGSYPGFPITRKGSMMPSMDRPLLLIMNGHQSHLNPELVQAAQWEGVILL